MIDLALHEPSIEYKSSFENYVLSYKRINDEFYFSIYKDALEDFQEYLNTLKNSSKGLYIPEGWAATSTFWLIDSNEVVGVVRIRHQDIATAGHIGYDISPNYRNKGYGSHILKLALEKAELLGIKNAIVLCSMDNIISRKIIEKNKGKLLGTVYDEEEDEHLYRYSIKI